jgi:hypothetical protein
VDHEYSLTYQEWNKIVSLYLEKTMKEIYNGKTLKMHSDLGFLTLNKERRKNKKIDFVKTRLLYGEVNKTLPKGEKKIAYLHPNSVFGKYTVFSTWDRRKSRLKYKWHWRFEFATRKLREFARLVDKDTSLINKIQGK